MLGVHNMHLMNALGDNDREMRVLCLQRTLSFPGIFIILGRAIESGNGWTRPALVVPVKWEIISMWHVGTTSLGEKRSVLAFLMCLVGFSEDKTFSGSIGTVQIYGEVGGA